MRTRTRRPSRPRRAWKTTAHRRRTTVLSFLLLVRLSSSAAAPSCDAAGAVAFTGEQREHSLAAPYGHVGLGVACAAEGGTVTLAGMGIRGSEAQAGSPAPHDGDAVVSINGRATNGDVGVARALLAEARAAGTPALRLRVVAPDQAQILRTFFACLGGGSWARSDGWPALALGGGAAELFGVTADGDGAVTRIELQQNGLRGELPASLGGLAKLAWLRVFGNAIGGTLPPALGRLGALQRLYLKGNQLTGSIPPELGACAAMVDLGVNENRLTGSLPPELGLLQKLMRLHVEDNPLTGVLPCLDKCAALGDVYIQRTLIGGPLPECLFAMPRARLLYLNGNRFSGTLPRAVGRPAATLEHLYLQDNDLEGSVPQSLTMREWASVAALCCVCRARPPPPPRSMLTTTPTLPLLRAVTRLKRLYMHNNARMVGSTAAIAMLTQAFGPEFPFTVQGDVVH